MPSSISSFDRLAENRKKHDERLISMAKNKEDQFFLATVAAAFLVLFFGWAAAVPYMPETFPVLNQGEINRARIVRYEHSPVRPIVLSGTSLMERISPEYFTQDVANIALAGESTVVSASFAARKNPPILLIEANILDRETTSMSTLPSRFSTTPVRAAVAAMFQLDEIAAQQSAHLRDDVGKMLARGPADSPPAEGVLQSYRSWNSRPLHAELNKESASELAVIADEVEANGGQVFYILLPVHPVLERSTYYRRGLEFLREVDPEFDRRLLAVRWSSEIRWDPDGAHVDERSAVVIAHQIEEAVSLLRN